MITRQKKRTNRGRHIMPLLALLVLGYFFSQAFQGDYGIRSHTKLQKKTTQLEKLLANTVEHRKLLEDHVALLRDGTIEKDMLDEQVRLNLGMVHRDDVIILR
jgi:cell division protein FtsB